VAGAVTEHYGAIMAEVLKEAGGRLWRNRQASCTAMAELLQGRAWAEVGPYLGRAWTMALRAMDDIKESVRAAGAALSRTLRGLTLRLVDTHYTPAAGARALAPAAVVLATVVALQQQEGGACCVGCACGGVGETTVG
jgi:proteasome component ECM29